MTSVRSLLQTLHNLNMAYYESLDVGQFTRGFTRRTASNIARSKAIATSQKPRGHEFLKITIGFSRMFSKITEGFSFEFLKITGGFRCMFSKITSGFRRAGVMKMKTSSLRDFYWDFVRVKGICQNNRK